VWELSLFGGQHCYGFPPPNCQAVYTAPAKPGQDCSASPITLSLKSQATLNGYILANGVNGCGCLVYFPQTITITPAGTSAAPTSGCFGLKDSYVLGTNANGAIRVAATIFFGSQALYVVDGVSLQAGLFADTVLQRTGPCVWSYSLPMPTSGYNMGGAPGVFNIYVGDVQQTSLCQLPIANTGQQPVTDHSHSVQWILKLNVDCEKQMAMWTLNGQTLIEAFEANGVFAVGSGGAAASYSSPRFSLPPGATAPAPYFTTGVISTCPDSQVQPSNIIIQ
jgi:hypothetical protein